jgi:hypothetical protein
LRIREDTQTVLDQFIGALAAMEDVIPLNIAEAIEMMPPQYKVSLEDHLGNTKIETFTEGDALPIWELTKQVRGEIEQAEIDHPDSRAVSEAWEHLLLSHNSDGRIGYWYSEWNPGEHKVAISRRKFIEDNLRLAQEALKKLPK